MSTKNVLTPEREAVCEQLLKRNWFKNTEESLREGLLNLPEDFDGFLKDLGSRPEIIGNVEVQKLVELNYGKYFINPVFEVRSNLTNEVFTYEYSSWKMGRETGCKGIVLIEIDNQIKYFLLKKSNKFPIGKDIYEAIGTIYPQFSSDKIVSFSAKIESQIKKILEIDNLIIKRYIDLGTTYPDAGMTNEQVNLFATVIEMQNEEVLKAYFENKNFIKSHKINFEIEILPINKLLEFVGHTDDGYFLSLVARLMSLNVVKL